MILLKASDFAEFSFYSTNDLNEKVFQAFLVTEGLTLFKTMGCTAEKAGTLIFLVKLVDKDVFTFGIKKGSITPSYSQGLDFLDIRSKGVMMWALWASRVRRRWTERGLRVGNLMESRAAISY
jgi:hypothetical protein